jgi:hypothetical protein
MNISADENIEDLLKGRFQMIKYHASPVTTPSPR